MTFLRQWKLTHRCGAQVRAALATLALLVSPAGNAAEVPLVPSVIPNPLSVDAAGEPFHFTASTVIIVPPGDSAATHVAGYLAALLTRTHGIKLPVRVGSARDNAINFIREKVGGSGAEAYQLNAQPQRVSISAHGTDGLRHGATTLWQLIDKTSGKPLVPGWKITDAPRFPWRGIMLDSARHVQSPAFIKDFIDWMALHKLNVLHWHLTDDQAWRIEIRKYPRLTSVGAWRVPAGAAALADIDAATGKPRLYGGFYSQQQVREIVAHAATRGVTIVPEIEMPGHASVTLVAYPKLGAAAKPPTDVPADWGVYENVYNIDDSTFAFLEDVLSEVMALFPGKYIHVGGDEVAKTQWKENPAVQARMRALGISEPAALQVYFTQRIGRYLQQHGRRLVGWDEILEPGLPPASVVMSWRGVEGALKAATKGFDTILSPWPTLYFDNRQSGAADELPGRGRVISLENVYRFEPMPENLTPAQQRHVLGLQGNVWTEHIRTEDRAAAMAFPRAAAIAETGWSAAARRDWPDFARRMATQIGRYDNLKIPYADSAFAVQSATQYTSTQVKVDLSTQVRFGDIRYTLDGREPDSQSALYQGPLTVPLPAPLPSELRAASFSGDQRLSRTRTIPLRRELAQRRRSQELTLCSANIDLSLEDDAPIRGPRAVFLMDINNPCWIFPQAELDSVTGVIAAVGQVPFNFQIGEDVKKIQFAKPSTPDGELEIHLGKCDGEIIARMPLAPATGSQGVTVLPPVAIAPRPGKHDLCLRFAQRFSQPAVDPVWALDWISLTERDPAKP